MTFERFGSMKWVLVFIGLLLTTYVLVPYVPTTKTNVFLTIGCACLALATKVKS